MSECLQASSQQSAGGYLLILGCSKTKREDYGRAPALEIYNGPDFQSIRKYLRENGWPPGLIIKIISAKYKIIDATTIIEPYDERLEKEAAKKMRRRVRYHLKKIGCPESVFVNMGKDYLPAVSRLETLFNPDRIEYANGCGNGEKRQKMIQWLHNLPNSTASISSQEQSHGPPLYFFPDWDDYVYEPFQEDETNEDRIPEKRKYAHEIFEDDPPYDGLLVSLAQLRIRNGRLSRLDKKKSSNFRDEMLVPDKLLLFGDCGAFSYIEDSDPPLSCEKAASLYDQFGFDLGTSVDHIPISSISERKQKYRMKLTSEYAEKFLEIHREQQYQFVPIGSVQGITAKHYAKFASEYVEWGYKHIALGGLVRRKDSEILEIVAAVREALQKQTRGKDENIWVHLFGILRPNLQLIFRHLGISSFDSASYLRKAWACPSRNYLTDDGEYGKWYSSIRIPFSTSKPMREVAASDPEYSNGAMEELEKKCLTNLKLFDNKKISEEKVLENVNKYSALLQRKKTYNHFSERHQELLSERPWKKCKCKVCKDAGIDIVIFRGANRNRRRGFHNTWVFYHKILHRKH
ncbi:MAG: tRNA-guanine transglycosylase DpdA [Candidatus Poribacteria bacterium]|nr:tRNA-guanine transglycosylase DpdA [Candidatus Poribacteria bacterium]